MDLGGNELDVLRSGTWRAEGGQQSVTGSWWSKVSTCCNLTCIR